MRFYLTHTLRPRPTRFDLGVSSGVDWSKNWKKGMDRQIFVSVSGKRIILGKWTAIVPKVSFCAPLLRRKLMISLQGTLMDVNVTISKVYNVKYVLASKDSAFRVDLWAHDPDSHPLADGWMTDMAGELSPPSFYYLHESTLCSSGAPYPNFERLCPVEADLSSLLASLPVRGRTAGDEDETKWFVQAEVEVCSRSQSSRTQPDLAISKTPAFNLRWGGVAGSLRALD